MTNQENENPEEQEGEECLVDVGDQDEFGNSYNFQQVLFRTSRYRSDGFVDEDEVLREARGHKEWKIEDATFNDLPKFDALTRYGISESEETLWAKEIQRLASTFREHRRQAYVYDLPKHDNNGAELSISDISNLAEAAFCNLQICSYDTALVILENQDNVAAHRTGSISNFITKAKSMQLIPRPPEALDSRTDEAYIKLIDYITGAITLLLNASATGESWDACYLAVLAKSACKLKDLASLKKHVSTDLDGMMEGQVPRRYLREHLLARQYIFEIMNQMICSLIPSRSFGGNYDNKPYEINTMVFSGGLRQSRLVMCGDRRNRMQVSAEPTQLWVTFHGCQILLANIQKFVSTKSGSYNNQHLTHDLTNGDTATVPAATLYYNWRAEYAVAQADSAHSASFTSPPYGISLSRADEIVTMILALTLSSSFVSAPTRRLIEFISTSADPNNNITVTHYNESPLFDATFTFSTMPPGVRNLDQTDPDCVPLSEFPFIRDPVRHLGDHTESNSRRYANIVQRVHASLHSYRAPSSNSREDPELGIVVPNKHKTSRGKSLEQKQNLNIRALEEQYEQNLDTIAKWDISDSSVTIPQAAYVVTVSLLFLAILIVGIIIMALFHNSMKGIDSSNIFNTIWIIGGFCVILAKSWSVKEWPWHDFMRCKLECNSVEEVALATGLDPQIILMYLLKRDNSRFRTDGPYNSFFINTQSASKTKFAIDKACKLSTLLVCGFVILGVSKSNGNYLVCIGGRRKNDQFNRTSASTEKRLVCKAPIEGEKPCSLFQKATIFMGQGIWYLYQRKISAIWLKSVVGVSGLEWRH